jgi:6-phosphofructokinase
MRVFLSYHFGNGSLLVHRVSYLLNKQPGIECYCWAEPKKPAEWQVLLDDVLNTSDVMVFFAFDEPGVTQSQEVQVFHDRTRNQPSVPSLVVRLAGAHISKPGPFSGVYDAMGKRAEAWELEPVIDEPPVPTEQGVDALQQWMREWEKTAEKCAMDIYGRLRPHRDGDWTPVDDLPIGYPVDYEKRIIQAFAEGNGILSEPAAIQRGWPLVWPRVQRGTCAHSHARDDSYYTNPIPKEAIGEWRDGQIVVVDVRGNYHCPTDPQARCLSRQGLTFPEAGPCEKLMRPHREARELRVGIVVAGGIAPGINAVISGICERHRLYQHWQHKSRDTGVDYTCRIFMYRDGFEGLVFPDRMTEFQTDRTTAQSGWISENRNLAGSTISTSRYDELLDVNDPVKRQKAITDIIDRLDSDHIDILYVIGGEGTIRASHAIHDRARKLGKRFAVVAIPKTMDNDILWVWQSFGFLSAVEKAKEFIMQLHTECKSNPRLCVVQLFGSDSGFVVNHAALGSGVCMAVLTPEVPYSMKALSDDICARLRRHACDNRHQSPHGIILLAETAVPQDVEDYIDNPDYPMVNLEEDEKTEIRIFVGSAYIAAREIGEVPSIEEQNASGRQYRIGRERVSAKHYAELLKKDWQELRKRIGKAAKAAKGDLDLLANTVKGRTVDSLSDPNQKQFFLQALNRLIQTGAPELVEINDPAVPAVVKIEALRLQALVAELRGLTFSNSLDENFRNALRRLRSFVLPHEAYAIADVLDPDETKRPQSRKSTLMQRLVVRVEETRKRILLESVLPALIMPRRSRARGERRVFGQTPDKLRTGTLKIVSRVLEADIRKSEAVPSRPYAYAGEQIEKPYWEWGHYRVFANEPRHLIRAIHPSVQDIIFGQRLGNLAVDGAMAGYTDFMVSQWLTEYMLVPLKLVVLGRKRVPPAGIFWKSVLASTGQASELW